MIYLIKHSQSDDLKLAICRSIIDNQVQDKIKNVQSDNNNTYK